MWYSPHLFHNLRVHGVWSLVVVTFYIQCQSSDFCSEEPLSSVK
jgi:hypothetical protein